MGECCSGLAQYGSLFVDCCRRAQYGDLFSKLIRRELDVTSSIISLDLNWNTGHICN